MQMTPWAGGIGDGLLEHGLLGGGAETHVDDPGSVIHRVIDGGNDIRQLGRTVGLKGLERHDGGRRRHQMDQARDHGAVAEFLRKLLAVQDRHRRLVENRNRGLIQNQWRILLIQNRDSGLIQNRHGGLVEVGQLGCEAGDVVNKVVTGHQNVRQCWMIRIDASIDHRDDIVAGGELLLGLRQLNQSCSGLLNIAGADQAPKIVNGGTGKQIGS